MIMHHAEPREILAALCRQADEASPERQTAFFLLEEGRWELAASSDLTDRSASILADIDPAAISLSDEAGVSCTGFLSRHFYSGIGELLGMYVHLNPGSGDADDRKIDSLCRFAVLAIEQRNLLDEMTSKPITTRLPAFAPAPASNAC